MCNVFLLQIVPALGASHLLDHQRDLLLTFHKYNSIVFVIGESCSSKYLNFNLLGKEVGQKPMNQHLEECLSLILLMAQFVVSLVRVKTQFSFAFHHDTKGPKS
jgi:hypothetical protein